MNDTGIVRRIDDLGRIVLPMELRRTLGIRMKDPLSISVDGERIILEKHHDNCAICGGGGEMVVVNDRAICLDCVALVKRI
jgi:transcriptional pleiotropic regulator of transition state genes